MELGAAENETLRILQGQILRFVTFAELSGDRRDVDDAAFENRLDQGAIEIVAKAAGIPA
jgi:hypothetical protein